MRLRTLLLCLLAVVPASGLAQQHAPVDAARATQHYRKGWELMREEAWERAGAEFQAAIVKDPRFALAYYALGRAEMYRQRFQDAIAAYVKCRQVYLEWAGDRFSSQLDANRAMDDRILEYREVLKQLNAQPSSPTRAEQIRNIDAQIQLLTMLKSRSLTTPLELPVPYFVPMALGAAYFRTGRFTDAEREYKEALKSNAASGETHNNLAVLYLETDRIVEAQREIELAETSGFKVSPGLKDELRARMNKKLIALP